MKDIQILWAACKYHWRRFVKLFKSEGLIMDDQGNYYTDGNYTGIFGFGYNSTGGNK